MGGRLAAKEQIQRVAQTRRRSSPEPDDVVTSETVKSSPARKMIMRANRHLEFEKDTRVRLRLWWKYVSSLTSMSAMNAN